MLYDIYRKVYGIFLCLILGSAVYAESMISYQSSFQLNELVHDISFTNREDIIITTDTGKELLYKKSDSGSYVMCPDYQVKRGIEHVRASDILVRINTVRNTIQDLYGLSFTDTGISVIPADQIHNPLLAQAHNHAVIGIATGEAAAGSVELYTIDQDGYFDVLGDKVALSAKPHAIALNEDATQLAVATQQELLLFDVVVGKETAEKKRALRLPEFINNMLYSSELSGNKKPLMLASVSNPVHGIVTHANNTITYTPASNYSGDDAFDYIVTDGSSTAQGRINVSILPVALDKTIDLEEDEVTFDPVTHGCDRDLKVNSIIKKPVHGKVAFAPGSNKITYTANQKGDKPKCDSFSYTVQDSQGNVSRAGTVIVNFAICVNLGVLTPVGSPVNTQNGPFGLTFAPNGTLAAVANASSATVTSYTVNPITGLITAVTNTPTITGLAPKIAFNASSTLLAVAGKTGANGTITLFSVSAGGVLTQIGATNSFSGATFQGVEFSPVNGGNAYLIALRTDNQTINSFSFNAGTGVVTNISSVSLGLLTTGSVFCCSPVIGSASYISVGAQISLLIIGLLAHVLTYQLNTNGTISTAISTALALTGLLSPVLAISYSPDGKCLVASNAGALSSCTVNQTNGILTLILTGMASLANPISLAFSPNSQNLFVINNQPTGAIRVYNVNSTTASFTAIYTLTPSPATQTTSVSAETNGNYIGVSRSNSTPGTIQIYGFARAQAIANTTTCGTAITFDPTGGCDNYTITAVTTPAPSGSAVFTNTPTKGITYTPVSGFSGIAAFTYTITDGTTSSSNTVTVSVNPTTSAVAQTFTCSQVATQINTTDCGTSPLTRSIVTAATNGTASISGTGQLQYAPTAGFSGTDSFTYRVTDISSLQSAPVTVNITINPVAAGIAVGSAPIFNCSSSNNIINTTSLDCGVGLTRTLVSTANAHGTVTINGLQQFVYTPTPNYSGAASFTYTVTDSGGRTSAVATVNIVVRPSAVGDSTTTTASC